MSDRDIDDLIVAIEQFGERQDWTGLNQRVYDFAKTTPDKLGVARQAIAQSVYPEFRSDQLEPAKRRNDALRRALEILTAHERLFFRGGLRQYRARVLQQPPQPWQDQADTPLPLKVSEEQETAYHRGWREPPNLPPSDLDTAAASQPDPSATFAGEGAFSADAKVVRPSEPDAGTDTNTFEVTSGSKPNEEFSAPGLPELPTQGPGPHFELTRKGVIDFVPPEALDRNGNNVARLRQLHPILRDLARELAEALGAGNIPHANLAARIGEYRKQVDQSLDKIDFAILYVEGLRLANAEKSAIEKIAEGELPSFRETDREALDTLLGLHGTFMLGTIAGAELIAAEERYRRRPAEEREYQAAAVDFAASFQNKPDVITPNAAAFVLGAAEQISQGANLERSGVIATGVILNIAITFTAVAMVTALPVVGGFIGGPGGAIAGGLTGYMASESLKKSKPFAAVIAPIIAKLDRAADLQKFEKFLRSVEQKARRLTKYNEQFSWLNRALDWIIPLPFNPDLLRRVDRLKLSSKALEIIRSDNVVYVGDLVQKTVAEMMRFPNCTRSIVNEISESLAYIGLHFGMELKDWPPDNIEDLLSKIGQP
jgi:hypothetical protein